MMAKFNYWMGAVISSWLLVVLVVVSELIKPFKDFLYMLFAHHWIGKAVLVAFFFFATGYFSKTRKKFGKLSSDEFAWRNVVGSLIVIFLFYVIEYFI
jgi:hypothetical protein